MELTGKCKEEFDKWFVEWYSDDFYYLDIQNARGVNWLYLSDSMQYGVLVDYFDSVGVKIESVIAWRGDFFYSIDGYNMVSEYYKTRPEARTKAIEKANEIRNQQL